MSVLIAQMLKEPQYAFVSDADKAFVAGFADRMAQAGYTFGDKIADGVCFGRYMAVFRRANVKSKTVYARIYLRNSGAVLRFYFKNITAHAGYISGAPDYIREPFTGEAARCNYCHGDSCKFRKSYEIDCVKYDKCNGLTFEFHQPGMEKLDEYMALFREFYKR